MEESKPSLIALASAAMIAASLFSVPVHAGNEKAAQRQAVIDHWTPERRSAAQPRDLVIDQRGLGYLRRADGVLTPHGHSLQAETRNVPAPNAKPGGGGNDSEPPQISGLDPANGATIGAAHEFSAVVTDNVAVRSVAFVLTKSGGQSQSFSASHAGNNVWTSSLSGFTDGSWTFEVQARDTAKGRGNSATESTTFSVDTAGGGGGGGGGGGDVVSNAEWTGGGDVQTAVGRLFYEMPSNQRRKRWAGYVCSGTVVQDGATGRSVILTASHCVYDDANGAFARNVLFIPNQAGTSGAGTDSNCDNDPLGCWVADFGVVDVNWTTRTFPDNVAWDYAFYVVSNDPASHRGTGSDDVLDSAAAALSIQFASPSVDDSANDGPGAPDYTHGMGYSYSDDPNFMYCAEDMTTEGAVNWWLPSCDLSGGSSGGPWFQQFDENNGTGPIISVNSWGYTTSPGMAGPKLSGTSADCVFAAAQSNGFVGNVADGDAGYAETCSQ